MIRMELIGNLTRDPESRTFQKGDTDGKVCNFTVAASSGYGQYKRTEFVRVAAWNGLGKTCMEYLKKGSKVYVAGTPTVNVYTNKDGNAAGNMELQLDEIEFLGGGREKAAEGEEETAPATTDEEDIDDLL